MGYLHRRFFKLVNNLKVYWTLSIYLTCFLVRNFVNFHFISPVKRTSGQLHVCLWSLESPVIPKNAGILHKLTANVAMKLLMSDHLLRDQNLGFHWEAVCGTNYKKSEVKDIWLIIIIILMNIEYFAYHSYNFWVHRFREHSPAMCYIIGEVI